MALSPGSPVLLSNQAVGEYGTAPQTPSDMQETLLLRKPIRQNDQETLEDQGRGQERHQNGDKTRADSFSGSAGIQHSRADHPTKGQTHATKVQVRYGICGSILRLHLCLPAKTSHQRRNSHGQKCLRALSRTTRSESDPLSGRQRPVCGQRIHR